MDGGSTSAETECEKSVKSRDTFSDRCIIVQDAGIPSFWDPLRYGTVQVSWAHVASGTYVIMELSEVA